MMRLYNKIKAKLHQAYIRTIKWFIKTTVLDIILNETKVWGDPNRLIISPKAVMINTLYNTSSGRIIVGDYTFTSHNVSLLTGTHDYKLFLDKRMSTAPSNGRDIIIGRGVWIGPNVTILGPCNIDDHAVIGAGSVVLPNSNIETKSLYAGVPAKFVKKINTSE